VLLVIVVERELLLGQGQDERQDGRIGFDEALWECLWLVSGV